MPRIASLAALVVASLASLAGFSLAAPPTTPRSLAFTPGVLLVATDDPQGIGVAPDGRARAASARVADVFARLGLEGARRLGPMRAAADDGGTRFLALRSTRADFDPLAAAAALRATGAFRAVSPDYRLSLFATLPTDPDVPLQWYVDDGGVADIRLPWAWDIERGDTSVVIAIMDTGVDTGHPDLATQIWHNPGEIPGNAIDDDGNGLVDDVVGWDFGRNDADPDPEYTLDASGLDVGFHGTFCAGIAAAAANNSEGIAGAAWDCRIMPLKVTHPDSGITTSAVSEAFLYAADQGVDVLSMSFGGAGEPGLPEYFQALVDVATAAGVLCLASAGNDGDSTITYPAACGDVVAVGATGPDGARASFSNYGPWVDVAAPGVQMWSTICRNYEFTDLDWLFYWLFFGWDGERPYMYGDGTSFSCPLTAGVCALIRSRHPSLTPRQVARHLVASGDTVAFDQPIGPRVNAFRAVGATILAVPAPVAVGLQLQAPAPNPSAGEAVVRFALPAAGPARLEVFDCAGRRVRALVRASLPAGPHPAVWDGRDGSGRPVAGGIYFVRLESGGAVARCKLVRLDR